MKYSDLELEKKDSDEIIRNENNEIMPISVKFDIKDNTPNQLLSFNDNLDILQRNMGNCLSMIEDEVLKGYLTKLSELPVLDFDSNILNEMQDIHFFKITELVYEENEFSVHKLATIFHTLSNKPCTLVLMNRSDGNTNNFYLGVRSLDKKYSSGTMMQMLRQSLLGMFPGSKIESYYDENLKKDMDGIKGNCISSATCIADFKQDKDALTNKDFIQGLEKFIYSMQGREYTSIFIANNLNHSDLVNIRKEYEEIYTQISPFANMQFNFSANNSKSQSDAHSEGNTQTSTYGLSEGSNTSISYGQSENYGVNRSFGKSDAYGINQTMSIGETFTKGYSEGKSFSVSDAHTEGTFKSVGMGFGRSVGINLDIVNFGASINNNFSKGYSSSDTHTVINGESSTNSISNSISKTLSHGISNTHTESSTVGENIGTGKSSNYGIETQNGLNYSTSNAFNLVDSKTLTETFGNSHGITLNAKNMTLNMTLDRIDKQLQRINECESMGMWNFAAYFLGESVSDTETAANTYQSVISGMQSGIETAAINTWVNDSYKNVEKYIKNFMHPMFLYDGFSYEKKRGIIVDPSALVSTNELAIHMGLPRYSIKGLPIVEHAKFAQEVLSKNREDNKIDIGRIFHLGERTETEVKLDVNSLTMHTFITGSTGAGKSNAVYKILDEAIKKNISFLVIEPAKGEYRRVFSNVRCFGTNPNVSELLKINPFSFPKEVHILEHIDGLIEIFNVCWPLYAAMPAVLKESIEQAYVSVGWDLDLSENVKIKGLYPSFDDVLRELNQTIKKSEYSSDTKGDYIGALSTRIKSLTNGINGRIFVSDEMNLQDLFDNSAILDISRTNSTETKALIMGLVVLKLKEYRMAHSNEMNSNLKHITVLEEAHNLLKKTSTEQSQESSNLIGKSVEMLTNTIAEIRTFGEGFIIVDQAPNLLDTAAIRNTNTKIVFRLPEENDRIITGAAMALNENQIVELSKLPTGVAALYQNDWQEAVLCSLSKYESENIDKVKYIPKMESRKKEIDKILHMLLKKDISLDECSNVKESIMKLNISAKLRKDLIENIEKHNHIYEWAVADFINKNYSFNDVFSGTCEGQWDTLEQLSGIMLANIKGNFEEFNEVEMLQILYYICRIEHELYPNNNIIEELRTNFLKERVMV